MVVNKTEWVVKFKRSGEYSKRFIVERFDNDTQAFQHRKKCEDYRNKWMDEQGFKKDRGQYIVVKTVTSEEEVTDE